MVIAICDDSREDRENIRKLLECYERENDHRFIIKEYLSGLNLCEKKEELLKCQIIFLKINMENMDGLKAAMMIKEIRPDMHIVLVTSHINYVIDGYKAKATRFLLKDDLERTIGGCMDDILDKIRRDNTSIYFPFVEGDMTLQAEEIIYIETNKHKNLFHTKEQTYSIYRKLNDIEKELEGMGFVRIHQSFLVNMRYVEKISSYVMKLTTGEELSVPKSRYQHVKQEYALYTRIED